MNPAVQRDMDWQRRYYRQIEAILRSLAHSMVDFRIATDDEDMLRATDFVIQVEANATVAGRMRRLVSSTGQILYKRDLTLRLTRPSGISTEEQKILAGWARWYLYIWTDREEQIAEWIFVDLKEMRKKWSTLLRFSIIKPNHDGSSTFRCIPVAALDQEACLIHWYQPQINLPFPTVDKI